MHLILEMRCDLIFISFSTFTFFIRNLLFFHFTILASVCYRTFLENKFQWTVPFLGYIDISWFSAQFGGTSCFPFISRDIPSPEKYNRVIGPFIPEIVDENKLVGETRHLPTVRRVRCVTETANSIPIDTERE